MIRAMRNGETTKIHDSVKTPSTHWRKLTERRKHVKRSVLLLLGIVPIALVAGLAMSLFPIPNSGPIAFALFLVPATYGLLSFAYYAVSFTRLACWRCPCCSRWFFGTTLFYNMPVGNTCKHCDATRD